MLDAPAIAVVPYGCWPNFGIADLTLDQLDWPLGRPERLSNGTIRDLGPQDHLITYPRGAIFWLPWTGVKAKVSVMIVEPDSVHGKHLINARWTYWRFWRVLSKNPDLLARLKNSAYFVFGSTFLEDIEKIDTHKSNMCSLIASAKSDLEGHQLRHKMVKELRATGVDVDIMGRAYKPFDKKADGLAPYRYSVIIENSRENGYFTEKLVDACICRTVPIYWGAPDIDSYFDTRGMIICESGAEILAAVKAMSVADYESRATALEANREAALEWAEMTRRAAEVIRDSLVAHK